MYEDYIMKKKQAFHDVIGEYWYIIHDMFPYPRYVVQWEDDENYIGNKKIIIFGYNNLDKNNHPKQYNFNGYGNSIVNIEEFKSNIHKDMLNFILSIKRDRPPIREKDINQDNDKYSIGNFIIEQLLLNNPKLIDENFWDVKDFLVKKLDYMYELGKNDAYLEIRDKTNDNIIGVEKDRFVKK